MIFKMPYYAEQIIARLNEHGHEAYLVGGCVRDFVMGVAPDDFDIATSALPSEVKALFERTLDTGIAHGTVTVLADNKPCEVTTFRTEGEYMDNRRPSSVKYVSRLEEDLRRRDFTMNALAYHPETGIVDPFSGLEDIKMGIIRAVGEPDLRFKEDGLRMLRAIRFACRFDFAIEDKTLEAMSENNSLIGRVSKERIRTELDKALCGQYPQRLDLLVKTGLSQWVAPWMELCFKTPQNTPYHYCNVGEHILKAVELSENIREVRWSAFLHDMGKPMKRTTDEKGIDHFKGHEVVSAELADDMLATLRFDNKTRKQVVSLILLHQWSDKITPYNVKKKLSMLGEEGFGLLLKLMEADTLAHSEMAIPPRLEGISKIKKVFDDIKNNNEPYELSHLAVNGNDVLKLGVKGNMVGEILKELLDLVLREPEKNAREFLLKRAKNMLGN